MYPSVHCNTVYNNQDMEATQMSNDRGMENKKVILKSVCRLNILFLTIPTHPALFHHIVRGSHPPTPSPSVAVSAGEWMFKYIWISK